MFFSSVFLLITFIHFWESATEEHYLLETFELFQRFTKRKNEVFMYITEIIKKMAPVGILH